MSLADKQNAMNLGQSFRPRDDHTAAPVGTFGYDDALGEEHNPLVAEVPVPITVVVKEAPDQGQADEPFDPMGDSAPLPERQHTAELHPHPDAVVPVEVHMAPELAVPVDELLYKEPVTVQESQPRAQHPEPEPEPVNVPEPDFEPDSANDSTDQSGEDLDKNSLERAGEHIMRMYRPETEEVIEPMDSVPEATHVQNTAHNREAFLEKEDAQAIVKPSFSSMAQEVVIDPSKHTILIVDDDEETRTLYSSVFRKSGYNVIEAFDGLQGLDLATKQQPDVIFTGIVMPRMDGFTMISSLKKTASLMDIPIVINSHLGRAQDEQRAKEIGVRDFIVKDYTSPREVVDRIDDILSLKTYIFPIDLSDERYKTFVADLGGATEVGCEGGRPALELILISASEKTFSAKLVCDSSA